jgi:hypothetical protein
VNQAFGAKYILDLTELMFETAKKIEEKLEYELPIHVLRNS